ncbi:thiamine ABC transporter substrate-binding protein [Schaalia sp. lx-100]|uniref:thiamine ABC transporter substrate-binding protein n=1 Tax=Schaalia sp. lx-100 TaxID=2899081 RepID=UPI001E4C24EF|nr:thiamine ABC transporter substrate-binding protein [Schaalia sp. lx-100]MCD4557924.1 thiamine ABC transporter substrate-binding protein [Schaalia sp. lx-100]
MKNTFRYRAYQLSATGAVLATALLALAGCSTSTGGAHQSAQSATADQVSGKRSIVVVSHDSFDFPQELLDEFAKETGINVTIHAVGDGGALANQLVLSKDAPLGDVVYGLDNTVSYRLAGKDVIAPTTVQSPDKTLNFTGENGLIPIDEGDVCVNLDKKWFADKGLTPPQTFEDLASPEYKDMLVAMSPATSTPGMAFMLATIAHYGQESWIQYWKSLKNNGMKVTQGWSDAFAVDYSAGEGAGPYPMMVSYGSSPAFSVTKDGNDTTTASLPATCYRQVEYAGVLKGTKDADAAAKFLAFMLTPKVQEAISAVTYMHPTVSEAHAPADLVKFGALSEKPVVIPAQDIAAHAEEWLRMWQDAVQG